MDDLQQVVQQNTARRQGEMKHAEAILREELRNHQRWQESHGALPTLELLKQQAEETRQRELQNSLPALASLSADDLRAVDRLSRGLVGKVLRGSVDLLTSTPLGHVDVQGAASHLVL